MRRHRWLALVWIAVWSWPAASLNIVCTTTIVGDVVARIAGPDSRISTLLPADSDPHAFEPTPRDLVLIARADAVFLNGAGLESELDPILEAASGLVVALSDGLDLRLFDASAGHDQGPSAVDPHVWFDPTYVAAWITLVEEVLIDLDPSSESEYRTRATAFRADVSELDAWIEERVLALPQDRRKLVTDHAVFGYFAARYGFEQVGTVFPGLSSLSEPSARDLAALEEAIASLGVPAVFVGTTVNRALAERVAADTGARVVTVYTGSLSEAGGPADSYLALMRYDVEAIVTGLSEER